MRTIQYGLVNSAMGQIPCSTERISCSQTYCFIPKNEGHSYCSKYLQGDEGIVCYTMLQVNTGVIANLSTQISHLWYICRWTIIILSGSIIL